VFKFLRFEDSDYDYDYDNDNDNEINKHQRPLLDGISGPYER